ncbi:hypothetical protein D9756_009266 [Leucocoprinus leucothites]|uniref:NACHT domain-containing protein n=1 Tax=Leucocoprinus leucothites TaxID=201217 RepID=A0A8H5FU82_9AGAR|nr:hypothetical protein D9756_009266 [Leucoagaricus leucothites]
MDHSENFFQKFGPYDINPAQKTNAPNALQSSSYAGLTFDAKWPSQSESDPRSLLNSPQRLPENSILDIPTSGPGTQLSLEENQHNLIRYHHPMNVDAHHEATDFAMLGPDNALAVAAPQNWTGSHLGPVTNQYITPDLRQGNDAQTSSIHDTLPQKQLAGHNEMTLNAFHKASNFAVYNPTFNSIESHTPDKFMENFASHAISAAAFDSSERDPPPRCHPGTRLETIERARGFFEASGRHRRLLWIVGPAGVGKSAIMQSTAETSPNLAASFFFSADAYDDPSKVVVTLAYQIAVKHHSYQNHLRQKLSNDPTLFKKAMPTQFAAFFVEPFANSIVLAAPQQLLILIDGLDECSGIDSQRKLLELISTFIAAYPNAPLLWIIASRPEPHITSFFSRPPLASIYEKLILVVNSSDSQRDVERYLWEELIEVKANHPALSCKLKWPSEMEFLQLAVAADGLFIFATTSLRFIDDPVIGGPASQLCLLLKVLNNTINIPPQLSASPLAKLYALYEGILARVPRHVLPDTYRLLLGNGVIDSDIDTWGSLTWACTFLGMTPESAYGALYHLHSLLSIPSPSDADHEQIRCHHKSFSDYLRIRFPSAEIDWEELQFHCAVRILKDIPAVASQNPCEHIILHWPEQGIPLREQRTDLYLYASHDLTNSVILTRHLLEPSLGTIHPDIIHALRVMAIGPDPRAFVADRGSTYGWFLRNTRIPSILIDRQIVHDIPIGVLDFGRVNESQYLHVICSSLWKLESEEQTLRCTKLEHDWTYSQHKNGTYGLTKIAECGCTCNKPVWNHLAQVKATFPETYRALAYVPAHRCGIVILDWHDGPKQWRFVFPYYFSPDLYIL